MYTNIKNEHLIPSLGVHLLIYIEDFDITSENR